MRERVVIALALAGCVHGAAPPHRPAPAASVAIGACGDPGRDGVVGQAPRLERADRDLDGDGRPEIVVVDRSLCTAEGNCYWNVFAPPAGREGSGAGSTRPAGECARYLGTFAGAALEPLAAKGDENMADVRAYWNQHDGRLLLQSYHFTRGGFQIVDVLQCKRGSDDQLQCADTGR